MLHTYVRPRPNCLKIVKIDNRLPLCLLYARYFCPRNALGLKAEQQPAGQARRATIRYYSAGKRDRGKRHPHESGGEAPRLHRTGGEAPCSMKGRKTRREENVFKGVENLPALLYTIV